MRIGFFLKQLDEEYQIAIYKGFCREAKSRSVEVVCIHGENFDLVQDGSEKIFRATGFLPLDGAVILSSILSHNMDRTLAEKLEAGFNGLPVVCIGAALKDAPTLKVDSKKAVYQLLTHLVEDHGYRRFLYFGGPTFNEDNVNRKKNITEFIADYRNRFPDLFLDAVEGLLFSESNGSLMAKDYLSRHPIRNIDTIICGSDEVALGALGFLKDSKNESWLNCPVTGFDDIPGASYFEPALTTIKQPLDEMGKLALRSVQDLVQGRLVQKQQTVEALYIQRHSCGCTGSLRVPQLQEGELRLKENLMRDTSYFGQAMMSSSGPDQIAVALQEFLERTRARFFYLFKFQADVVDSSSLGILEYRMDKSLNDKVEVVNIRVETPMLLAEVMDKNSGTDEAFHLAYLRCGQQDLGFVFYSAPDETQTYFSHSFVFLANTFKSFEVAQRDKAYAKNLEAIVKTKTKDLLDEATRRQELEEEILKIGDMERRRFAMDLHDDICQRLAGMCMICDQLTDDSENVEMLSGLMKETLQRTRQYAHESFPVEIEDLLFPDSLGGLCAKMNMGESFSCLYEQENALPELTEKQKINIYRIVQEALRNAKTHSGGTKAIVRTTVSKTELTVTIEDDGKGFDSQVGEGVVKSSKRRPEGLGIKSMKYRAHQIGAGFSISTRPGQGTRLVLGISLSGRVL